MNDDHKSRLILPILIPLGILVVAAAFIGAIAFSLLYNTHEGSLMLAAVVAGGILFTVSLASAQDGLDARRRGVIVFAAVLPILVGLGIATDIVPGVEDDARMVNVQPLVIFPDDAPVIAAENEDEFCLPDNGGCEPIERWDFEISDTSTAVAFTFDNREAGVPHNVVISELAGDADAPERGEDIVESTVITGEASEDFIDPTVTWDELPAEWYFLCEVHPRMNGVGTHDGSGGDADGGGDTDAAEGDDENDDDRDDADEGDDAEGDAEA